VEKDPHRRAADRFAERLQTELGERLISVVLYGSVARSEHREDSDVDMLVVVSQLPTGAHARRNLIRRVEEPVEDELRSERPFACIITVMKTPTEVSRGGPLFYDMTLPGGCVVYFDRDDSFADFLQSMREKMQKLGSIRRHTDTGYPYWDLKPDWRPGDKVDL